MILEDGLECYYCGHEEDDECGSKMPDDSPYFVCQMSSPDEPHYGDSCYVGHSGSAIAFKKYMTMRIMHSLDITLWLFKVAKC